MKKECESLIKLVVNKENAISESRFEVNDDNKTIEIDQDCDL